MLRNILPYFTPLRIRVRSLKRLSELSPVQIISIVAVAIICVCFLAFLDKKKPEWKGIKNKAIMLALMFILIVIVLFIFK